MKRLSDNVKVNDDDTIDIQEILKNEQKKIVSFIGIRKQWDNFYDK